LTKRVTNFIKPALPAVRWEDGSLTTNGAEYNERFLQHVQEFYDGEIVEAMPAFPDCSVGEDSDSEGYATSLTLDKCLMAIDKLKNNKAVGPDKIPSELIKPGGVAFAIKLKNLIDNVWSSMKWPHPWRGGRIKPLHKKGDETDVDNHRGLLISDHMQKVASEMI